MQSISCLRGCDGYCFVGGDVRHHRPNREGVNFNIRLTKDSTSPPSTSPIITSTPQNGERPVPRLIGWLLIAIIALGAVVGIAVYSPDPSGLLSVSMPPGCAAPEVRSAVLELKKKDLIPATPSLENITVDGRDNSLRTWHCSANVTTSYGGINATFRIMYKIQPNAEKPQEFVVTAGNLM
jgi:hypothetical protein